MSAIDKLKAAWTRATNRRRGPTEIPKEEPRLNLKIEEQPDLFGRHVMNIDELKNVVIRTKEGYLLRLWTEWDPSATYFQIDGEDPRLGASLGTKRINLRLFMVRQESLVPGDYSVQTYGPYV